MSCSYNWNKTKIACKNEEIVVCISSDFYSTDVAVFAQN